VINSTRADMLLLFLLCVMGACESDATPPVVASGFPRVVATHDTSVEMGMELNEEGKIAFLVQESSTTAPTYSTVAAIFGDGGVSIVSPSVGGVASIATRNTEVIVTISGLRPSTTYMAFIASQDDHTTPNNLLELSTLGPFTTLADSTPPVFSSGWPATTVVGERSVTVGAKINEAGRVFIAFLPQSADTPTTANLRAGTVTGALGTGSGVVSDPGDLITATASGLVEATTYDAWFVAEDTSTPANLQSSPTKISFTTLPDATIPEFLVCSRLSRHFWTVNDPHTLRPCSLVCREDTQSCGTCPTSGSPLRCA